MTVVTAIRSHATTPTDDERGRPAPIIAAVDASPASRAAVEEAVVLAAELDAPLVFVYVRRGPSGLLGWPLYQRRLTREMQRARRVLDRALLVAGSAGVEARGEILEGSPRRRIVEFTRDHGAQLIIVGSRRRRLGRSVAFAVARTADQPVVVAARERHRRAGLSPRAVVT